MVWLAIKSDGRLIMRLCPKTVDSEEYIKILKEKLVHKFITEKGFIFQQDGATPHTSKATVQYLTKSHVAYLKGVHPLK